MATYKRLSEEELGNIIEPVDIVFGSICGALFLAFLVVSLLATFYPPFQLLIGETFCHVFYPDGFSGDFALASQTYGKLLALAFLPMTPLLFVFVYVFFSQQKYNTLSILSKVSLAIGILGVIGVLVYSYFYSQEAFAALPNIDIHEEGTFLFFHTSISVSLLMEKFHSVYCFYAIAVGNPLLVLLSLIFVRKIYLSVWRKCLAFTGVFLLCVFGGYFFFSYVLALGILIVLVVAALIIFGVAVHRLAESSTSETSGGDDYSSSSTQSSGKIRLENGDEVSSGSGNTYFGSTGHVYYRLPNGDFED